MGLFRFYSINNIDPHSSLEHLSQRKLKKNMIQTKDANMWKDNEYVNLMDMINLGKSYESISWNTNCFDFCNIKATKNIKEISPDQEKSKIFSDNVAATTPIKLLKKRREEVLKRAEKSIQKLHKDKELARVI